MVVFVGGDVVNVIGGAWWRLLWEVMWLMWLVVHSGGDCGRSFRERDRPLLSLWRVIITNIVSP